MDKSKMSFAFLILVLTTGFTIAKKAGAYKDKTITDCFRIIKLRNAENKYITLASGSNVLAETADTIAFYYPFVTEASNPTKSECLGVNLFCCATLQRTDNSNAPEIDLGNGKYRYTIAEIYYHINN